MSRFILLVALPLFGVATAVAARATPECRIRVLSSVLDDMGNHFQTGQTVPATIMRRDKTGGSFCAHGGSCVPRMANGRQVTRLLNCRPASPSGDYVDLIPDPKAMGAADFRQMTARARAEHRLSDLGFDNASAGGLAESYASDPGSRNGKLVAQALAGSRTALATLKKRNAPR